jgi:hypothetical protein
VAFSSRDGEKRRYLPLFDEPGFAPNPPYVVDGDPWSPDKIAGAILLDLIMLGPSFWFVEWTVRTVSSWLAPHGL